MSLSDGGCVLIRQISRKLSLCAAATAIVLGAGAPALAGGGYYGGYYGHHGGYYSAGYGGHYGYRGHHRGHRRGHHGHGGGKGALIALGVIGGAIILNEAAESRARERAYEARVENRYNRYDRYSRRATPAYNASYDIGEYDAGPDDGNLSDNGLEPRLDGGPEPIRVSYANAYQACTKHARAALGNRGFVLAAPAKPDTAEDVGGAWKMTATVTAQKGDDSWSRAMYCEADDSRVYLLELI